MGLSMAKLRGSFRYYLYRSFYGVGEYSCKHNMPFLMPPVGATDLEKVDKGHNDL